MEQHSTMLLAVAALVVQYYYSCSVTAHLLDEDSMQLFYITPSSNMPCAAKPCLTLSQFADNSSSWLSSLTSTSLMLLSGTHMLTTDLSITAITFFMLTSSTSDGNHFIRCQYQASYKFENMTELSIKGLTFIGCGNNTFSSIRNFTIENSTFQGQNASGTVLDIANVNLTILNSSFLSNSIGRCIDIYAINIRPHIISVRVGGAIFVDKSNVSIIKCTFSNNSAEVGGAIYSTNYKFSNNISISNSTFIDNQANIDSRRLVLFCDQPDNPSKGSTAGAIAVFQSKLKISDCIFTNNTSEMGEGGALAVQQESTLRIYKSEFHGNTAKSYGGAFIIREIFATINSSVFISNSATQGGVIHAIQKTIAILIGNVFKNNSAKSSGGVISTDQNSLLCNHHGRFFYNKATTGGVLYAIRSGVILEHSAFSHNQAEERGGAIYVLQSHTNITILGRSNLTHNSAGTGGAICAIESTLISLVYIYTPGQLTQLTIAYNTANQIGGGIYLQRSVFNSRMDSVTNISRNSASSSGGGMYATNSLIICTEYYRKMNTKPNQTLIFFANNSALKGGGLYLESSAQLRIQRIGDITNLFQDTKLNSSIHFTSNTAEYGTAVYVADETYFDVCNNLYGTANSTTTSNSDCFIQVFSESTIKSNESNIPKIHFRANNISKSMIFGGLLDRCIPDPRRAEIYTSGYILKEISGLSYLKLISNIKITEHISSLPVRLCFCNARDNKPNCSYEPAIIHVKKGESFNVTLVAVDQVNHTLKDVEVYSALSHTQSSLGEGQTTQATKNACTNLTFSIISPHTAEQLILYPEGPCRNASRSQSSVQVIFQSCTCPIGFQPRKYDSQDCLCICNSRLSPYFSEADNNCDIQTESLARHGNFWIGFNNENISGFLIYPYCPLDYCLPSTSNVNINLNLDNGSDAQCANNRSGLLCSLCRPGLSLSLGSSRCIPCSRLWYTSYVPIILITMIAGILLVVVLLTFKITVDTGLLNGLIFYANIIGADSSTFFSGLLPSTKFHLALVSWLNLEVGFDVCFFEGMENMAPVGLPSLCHISSRHCDHC